MVVQLCMISGSGCRLGSLNNMRLSQYKLFASLRPGFLTCSIVSSSIDRIGDSSTGFIKSGGSSSGGGSGSGSSSSGSSGDRSSTISGGSSSDDKLVSFGSGGSSTSCSGSGMDGPDVTDGNSSSAIGVGCKGSVSRGHMMMAVSFVDFTGTQIYNVSINRRKKNWE